MPLTIQLDKTTYKPGDVIAVRVEADVVSPTVPYDYTFTATRTVDGVEESDTVTVTVQYPQTVTDVTVTGSIPLTARAYMNDHWWDGTIPTERPAA